MSLVVLLARQIFWQSFSLRSGIEQIKQMKPNKSSEMCYRNARLADFKEHLICAIFKIMVLLDR